MFISGGIVWFIIVVVSLILLGVGFYFWFLRFKSQIQSQSSSLRSRISSPVSLPPSHFEFVKNVLVDFYDFFLNVFLGMVESIGLLFSSCAKVFKSERFLSAVRGAFLEGVEVEKGEHSEVVDEGVVRSRVESEISDKFVLIPKKSFREGSKGLDVWFVIFVLVVLSLFANVFMIFFGSFILKWWFWIVVGAGVGCGVIIVLYLLSSIVSGSTRIFSKPLLLSGRSVLFATGWGVGLQEVLLRMKTSFSNARVKISRSRPKGVLPGANVFEWFSVSLPKSVSGDVDECTFKLRISKSWLLKRGIDGENLSVFSRGPSSWKSLPVRIISSDDTSYIVECSAGFGVFALGVKNSLVKWKPFFLKRFFSWSWNVLSVGFRDSVELLNRVRVVIPWKMTLVFLLLVILLSGSVWYYRSEVSKRPVVISFENGIPPQVWDMNSVKSLDLNNYFSDPDGEQLFFSYSDTTNVDVEIANGIVLFTPHRDFVGEEGIVFTVTDPNGETVSSNIVLLVVVKPSFQFFVRLTEWIAIYYKFIVSGLALGVFIIVGWFLLLERATEEEKIVGEEIKKDSRRKK